MSIKGIDISDTKEFVSTFDEGEEKTKFVLKVISHRDKMKSLSGFDVNNPDIDSTFGLVASGLKKIIGLDVKGEKKDIEVVSADDLEVLPMNIVFELMNEILLFNGIGGEEEKN